MPVKKLFYNGNILTLNSAKPRVTSMFVKGDEIEDIFYANCTNDLIKKDKLKDVKIDELIDLKGRTVFPGFNDSHLHLTGIGEVLDTVDLSDTKSLSEIQQKIQEYINEKEIKPGAWIIGRGWNQNKYPGRRLPDRFLLDKVSPLNPLILRRICGHISVANSKALKIAGIEKDKQNYNYSGGKIDYNRDSGEPTGILRENAIGLVERHIPEPTVSDFKRWIEKAARDLAKSGLTSVQTDDFGNFRRFEQGYQAYKELKDAGELPLRINLQVRIARLDEFKEFVAKYGLKTGSGDRSLKIGPCKILADGSMGGHTAALFEPYSDQPETRGTLLYSPEQLWNLIKFADKAGFQLAIHGIGDRAIGLILNLYEKLLKIKKLSGREAADKLRERIIHSQLTNYDLIEQIKETGTAVDVQPIFLNSDLHIAEERLGSERLKGTYAWKTMLEKGINLGGSSDGPVESFNPLDGIFAAVTRRDLNGYPDEGWKIEEALELIEALKIYTIGSAYNSFEDEIKGTLEKGKLADFVVLSQNPFEVTPEELKDINVMATYIGGKKI